MRPSSRHVKLGLFALLGLAAVTVALLYLGLQRSAATIYHTYFDESVQGLDEGAIVKFRGVRIGKVARIGVAPDRRLIDVELAIDEQRARALDLRQLAPRLRAQLVIFGITGVKLIDLDFVTEQTPPPPKLAFEPPERYIPSQPSLLTTVEEDLVAVVHKLPTLVDRTVSTLESLDQIAREFSTLLTDTRTTVTAIGSMARRAARANVPRSLAKTLTTVDDLGRRVADVTDELDRSLRQIAGAARAMQDFFETLEREPDILIRGRARSGRQ